MQLDNITLEWIFRMGLIREKPGSLVCWDQYHVSISGHCFYTATRLERGNKNLLMQTILHSVTRFEMGWAGRWTGPPRRTPVCTGLASVPARPSSNVLAFLSLTTLPLAEVKMRHKRTVWQLMNTINLLWIRKGGCAQQPRKCSCLSRTLTISGVPNISPFARSQLHFFSFLVHNIFVNIVFSFSLNFLLTLFILFAPLHLASSSTLLTLTQSSPVLCKTQQSHSLWNPGGAEAEQGCLHSCKTRLGRQCGYVPVLINRELLVTV